jgi:cysteine dioxygenase
VDLQELIDLARDYDVTDLPVRFGKKNYTRRVVHHDDDVAVVVVCLKLGQATPEHDHQGSHCVLRVVRGRVMERLLNGRKQTVRVLRAGDVTGLDGRQVHQVIGTCPTGSVCLNVYSPPMSS